MVVEGPQTLRTGPGEGWDAALTEAVGAGTEVTLRTTNAGWVEVAVPGGTTGWLPSDAVEPVQER